MRAAISSTVVVATLVSSVMGAIFSGNVVGATFVSVAGVCGTSFEI